jgi:putative ribosome biogenesis GTPase RsgA
MLRGTSMFLEVVSLPPTSLKAVRQFFLKLVTQGIQYYQCIIRIDLVEAKNAQQQVYGKAAMKFVRKLSADEIARASEFRALAESISGRVSPGAAAE